MESKAISRFVPRQQKLLIVCLILVSVVDSTMVGYNSSLMGSLNVMPSYRSYFELTTATRSLNTAISYVGGSVVALFGGFLADWRGRRESIFWACCTILVGAVIQAAAQNIGMFISGRFIIGGGMALAQTAAPILVAETIAVKYRAFALAMYYACWGVGTLVASGVCYGTQRLDSTWAWRIPSLLQALPMVLCIAILLFVPESPRWLISRDRADEAMAVLSIVNAGDGAAVQVQYREIHDTIRLERERGLGLRRAVFSLPANQRRLLIASTFSIIVMLPGTNFVQFYFGDMLAAAGIRSPDTQLQVNIVLTSWTTIVAFAGSYYTDRLGRKWLCSLSLAAQAACLLVLGGLTKLYGASTDTAGIYGTISAIFFYNAFYAWGITPLTVLYPPEILSFDIRGVGMGIYTTSTKLCGLFVTVVAPFGLDAIGYQMYMINACLDVLMVVFVALFWVETRGLTLEQVDGLFDREKREIVAEQVKEEVGVDIDRPGKTEGVGAVEVVGVKG
ncbi:high-affinity glucose transporter [Gaeumannomyces tritici R3-111a-1]|uniref:High-affinity glucose transporter n=1 Tax=Gaeumannomyces tritici (strain R3-111a-1) TaxID=644352 RepID=J3P692_GAET3|nr:high-affinity glucose transporter [Gaeumannomyces tritici R3-111a-1]EJT72166.1 high-affinity glucose transporter [Gaeumannomyces tritici R3-111a-1]